MKQTLLVVLLTAIGTLGPFVYSPFWGVAVYYVFAVLRPQYIWERALPADVQWSRFVALSTIASVLAMSFGLLSSATVSGRSPKRGTSTNRIAAAFFVWMNASYFMAFNRDVGFDTYIEYIKTFTMFFGSSLVIIAVRQLWILFLLTALSLAYICYEVNALYLFQGYLGISRNGYGGLDNNGAGLMLAMGMPLCLMSWDGMQSRWRWAFLAMVPVIVHAVLMTFSRGAMLSMLVTCLILPLRCRRKAQLAPFAIMLALLIPWMAGREIQERFFTIQENEVDESANIRRRSWAAAWAIAKDNPIFGVGIRNANLFSHQYGADMEGRTIHNQYLQIAADNGFVGLGLYLALISSVWLDTRRARRFARGRDDEESRRLRAIAGGIEGSLITFCVGGVFLSLEQFELPYLVFLMGAQASSLSKAAAIVAPSVTVGETTYSRFNSHA